MGFDAGKLQAIINAKWMVKETEFQSATINVARCFALHKSLRLPPSAAWGEFYLRGVYCHFNERVGRWRGGWVGLKRMENVMYCQSMFYQQHILNEHCPSERKDCFSWETFQNTFTELFVLARTTVKSRRKKNSKPNM